MITWNFYILSNTLTSNALQYLCVFRSQPSIHALPISMYNVRLSLFFLSVSLVQYVAQLTVGPLSMIFSFPVILFKIRNIAAHIGFHISLILYAASVRNLCL